MEEYNDESTGNTITQNKFGQDLISELIAIIEYSFGNISNSIILVPLVFMLETLMSSSSAKLLFVCGYVILFIIFNTVAVVCFPQNTDSGVSVEEGEGGYDQVGGGTIFKNLGRWLKSRGGGPGPGVLKKMSPLINSTRASFYNFSLGYLFGYWANLNIIKNTPNSTMNNFYYIAVIFFCYVFSVFYVKSCSWESGLISLALGIIGGLVWAQLVSGKIDINSTSNSSQESTSVENEINNATTCTGSSNDNVVCNAFRVQ